MPSIRMSCRLTCELSVWEIKAGKGRCQRREGGRPLWYWQNNANKNFALFMVAELQELHLTQTRLSPEGSGFSFLFTFPPSLALYLTHTHCSSDLPLLMKVWITKMLNVDKSPWIDTSECYKCYGIAISPRSKSWTTLCAEGWKKKTFSRLKLIKNVFVFLFCNATMLSCMLNCSKTQHGWFTSSQMHQMARQCRCHWDFFFPDHEELWFLSQLAAGATNFLLESRLTVTAIDVIARQHIGVSHMTVRQRKQDGLTQEGGVQMICFGL